MAGAYRKLRDKCDLLEEENEQLKRRIKGLTLKEINIDVPHYKAKIQYLTEQLAKAQSKLQGQGDGDYNRI